MQSNTSQQNGSTPPAAGAGTTQDGGSVFPSLLSSLQIAHPDAPPSLLCCHTEGGITKRELFAGLALQGLLSAAADIDYGYGARQAVDHADALLAMLAARSKAPAAPPAEVNAELVKELIQIASHSLMVERVLMQRGDPLRNQDFIDQVERVLCQAGAF